MPLHAGDVFAGYTIQRLLGAGGMGEVYLAQHPRLPRHDALKILPASLTSDAQYRDRFNREADIAASLWHQHIVALHDRGEADGQLWIAMDYVEGTDASRLIRERYPSGLPLKEATEIISAIADALDYAHARNLLHRDVKPANILLTRPDNGKLRIFLADFGVARRTDDVSDLTATNMTVGSMRYSAPEQLMGQPLDGRADQYALAATAYQLLTGHSPFNDTNPAVIITKHLSEPPPRVSQVRPELRHLDEVIARGLAKEPANRFALCGDFARALTEGGSAGSSGYTQPTTPTSAARLPPPPTAPQQPRSATGPSWPSNTAVPYPPTSPTTPAWAPTASEAPRDPSAPGLPRPKKRDRAKVVIPALLAVLLVASGVFAVSQFVRPAPVASDTPEWQPYVEAAKEFIVLMSSLGKNNANDVQKILDKSTGTFHSDYEKSALERKSSLLRYDINSKGTVNGAALESFKPGQADVLISSVQETTFPDKPSSTLNYLSVVTVVSTDDGYKTSALVPVK